MHPLDSASPPSRSPDAGDLLVLAALERALRQRPPTAGPRGATMRDLLAHLGRPGDRAAARRTRAALARLCDSGLVESGSRHGVAVWRLVAAGERLLATRRGAIALGPSPQQLARRDARRLAGAEIDRLRAGLWGGLARAAELLAEEATGAGLAMGSDRWLMTGREIEGCCRRLASAIHILHEWPPPDERRADIDDLSGPADAVLDEPARARLRVLRAGRRNTRLWDDARP